MNRDRSLYLRIVEQPAGQVAEHCGSLARRFTIEASPRRPVSAPERRSPCQAGDKTPDPSPTTSKKSCEHARHERVVCLRPLGGEATIHHVPELITRLERVCTATWIPGRRHPDNSMATSRSRRRKRATFEAETLLGNLVDSVPVRYHAILNRRGRSDARWTGEEVADCQGRRAPLQRPGGSERLKGPWGRSPRVRMPVSHCPADRRQPQIGFARSLSSIS